MLYFKTFVKTPYEEGYFCARLFRMPYLWLPNKVPSCKQIGETFTSLFVTTSRLLNNISTIYVNSVN